MKKIFLALIAVIIFCSVINAQNDTMYIMKSGLVIDKYNVHTQVDSIIFYQAEMSNSTFIDSRDSNIYQIVTIGNQVWMAENLKYLPSITEPNTGSATTLCYYVYGYNGTNVDEAKESVNYNTYGVLYNWAAAMAGSASSVANPSVVQGVCPIGWHLPSYMEWTELTDYLGGDYVAGGKLKETGTIHWNSPNEGATNETGFTALPGGYYQFDEDFSSICYFGIWWNATEYNTNFAWSHYLNFSFRYMYEVFSNKASGLAVRCVRN